MVTHGCCNVQCNCKHPQSEEVDHDVVIFNSAIKIGEEEMSDKNATDNAAIGDVDEGGLTATRGFDQEGLIPPVKKKMPRMPKRDSQRSGKRSQAPLSEFIGSLTEEQKQEAERIRSQCMASRIAKEVAEAIGSVPVALTSERLVLQEPAHEQYEAVNALSGEWQKLSIAIDSGASETVIPYEMVVDHPIQETRASRTGYAYQSATGEPIPNLGEQKLPLYTMEGTIRGMTFQACPVAKPLGSVKKMCKSGHRV
eukprot:8541661-Karenia_brevis.AAC.1